MYEKTLLYFDSPCSLEALPQDDNLRYWYNYKQSYAMSFFHHALSLLILSPLFAVLSNIVLKLLSNLENVFAMS